MKKALILLAIFGLLASPVFAANLEAAPAQKHTAAKHHAATKRQKKHLKKKVARRATRKHKIAV